MLNVITLLSAFIFSDLPDSIAYKTPQQLIDSAYVLIAQDSTSNAVHTLLSISKNDTAYLQSRALLLSVYNELKEHEKTTVLAKTIKDNPSAYQADIFLEIGNAYLSLEKFDSALFYYAEGLTVFPHNYLLWYNCKFKRFTGNHCTDCSS